MSDKKKPRKEYPDAEYASLSIPRQYYIEILRALAIAMHCFGAQETAQHAPSAEVFKRLGNLIIWALEKAGYWNATTKASYTDPIWLVEKEAKANLRKAFPGTKEVIGENSNG